jgi:hypothetical protein
MALAHAVLVRGASLGDAEATAARQLTAEQRVLAKLQEQLDKATAAAAASASSKGAGGRKGAAAAGAAGAGGGLDTTAGLRASVATARSKVAQLDRQLAALSDFKEQGARFTQTVMSEVFSNRYRDVSADVRAEALLWFGRWLPFDPDAFLTNGYLKYLGWTLNDGASHVVRRLALQSVALLYAAVDGAPRRLKDFIARFRPRIAEMARDVAPDVCAAAVNALHWAMEAGQLDASTAHQLYPRLLDDSLSVRQAVAALAADQLEFFRQEEGEGATGAGAEDGAAAGAGSVNQRAAAKGARAAAAAVAAARRHRQQLLGLMQLCGLLVPAPYMAALQSERAPADAAGGAGTANRQALRRITRSKAIQYGGRVVDRLLSGFWGHPRAAVLCNWAAFTDLLLEKSVGGGGGKAGGGSKRSGAGAGADGAEGEEDGEDVTASALSPAQALMGLRMLSAVALRLCGEGRDECPAGIPAVRPGVEGSDGAASSSSSSSAKAGGGKKAAAAAAAAAAEEADAAAPTAVGPGAGLSVFRFSTATEEVAAARDAFSAALLPALPDLLAKYGGDAEATVSLCAVIRCLAPAVFAAPRASKAFADALYHLGRAFDRHSEERPLVALAEALAFLGRGQHARAREAQSKVRALLEGLSERLPALVGVVVGSDAAAADAVAEAAGAAGSPSSSAALVKRRASSARSRRSGAGAGAGSAGSMDVDDEEAEGTGAGEGGSSACVDMPSTLAATVAVLRRLRVLVQAYQEAAELAPEALAPAGPVVDSVSGLLTHCRRLTALFKAASKPSFAALAPAAHPAGAARGGKKGAASSTAAAAPAAGATHAPLHPALVSEGLALLQALFANGLWTLCQDAAGAESVGEWAVPSDTAHALSTLRDDLLLHLRGYITLRHPDALLRAAAARQRAAGVSVAVSGAGEGEEEATYSSAGGPGGEKSLSEAVDDVLAGVAPAEGEAEAGPGASMPFSGYVPGLSVDTYALNPLKTPLAERAYILRCRHAAFSLLPQLGALCARATLERSALEEVASLNVEALVDGLLLFLPDALAADALDLAARGAAVPGVSERLETLLGEAQAYVPHLSLSFSGTPSAAASSAAYGGSTAAARAARAAAAALPRALRPVPDLSTLVEDEDAAELPVSGDAELGEDEASVAEEFALAYGGEIDEAAAAAAGREVVPEATLHAQRASHVLLPLAALSLCFPNIARLSAALASRVTLDRNAAGAAGVAVVRSYLKALRTRFPQAYLLADLQTMLNSALELAGASARLQALREAGDVEAAEEAEGEVLEQLQGELGNIRRQLAALGVAKAAKGMWTPLHNTLKRAVEIGEWRALTVWRGVCLSQRHRRLFAPASCRGLACTAALVETCFKCRGEQCRVRVDVWRMAVHVFVCCFRIRCESAEASLLASCCCQASPLLSSPPSRFFGPPPRPRAGLMDPPSKTLVLSFATLFLSYLPESFQDLLWRETDSSAIRAIVHATEGATEESAAAALNNGKDWWAAVVRGERDPADEEEGEGSGLLGWAPLFAFRSALRQLRASGKPGSPPPAAAAKQAMREALAAARVFLRLHGSSGGSGSGGVMGDSDAMLASLRAAHGAADFTGGAAGSTTARKGRTAARTAGASTARRGSAGSGRLSYAGASTAIKGGAGARGRRPAAADDEEEGEEEGDEDGEESDASEVIRQHTSRSRSAAGAGARDGAGARGGSKPAAARAASATKPPARGRSASSALSPTGSPASSSRGGAAAAAAALMADSQAVTDDGEVPLVRQPGAQRTLSTTAAALSAAVARSRSASTVSSAGAPASGRKGAAAPKRAASGGKGAGKGRASSRHMEGEDDDDEDAEDSEEEEEEDEIEDGESEEKEEAPKPAPRGGRGKAPAPVPAARGAGAAGGRVSRTRSGGALDQSQSQSEGGALSQVSVRTGMALDGDEEVEDYDDEL